MNKILAAIIVIFSLQPFVYSQAKDSCASFQQLVKATYNFKPARLSDAERNSKSAALDQIWNTVKAHQNELLPCLRAALDDPQADPFFRFDGSSLLVEIDPSPSSKAIQIRSFTAVDLDDVDLRVWVTTLALRGTEGFDVSEAGARWLAYPKARYFLPEHGAYEVKAYEGALFIYGSMDEAQATPALVKIISQANHPGREHALRILMMQATPESIRALRNIDLSGFPERTRQSVRRLLEDPKLFTPRTKPKTSREEFLKAFQNILKGDWSSFLRLTEQVPDGERDVVAALKAEDMPLVRKVRRLMIANGNQHAVEFYDSFTEILMTLVKKYEPIA